MPSIIEVDSSESESGYAGGVNHIVISSDDESDGAESGWEAGCESVKDFDENDVLELRKNGEAFLELREVMKNLYDEMEMGLDEKKWKKIETNRSLGYNGHSERTKRRQRTT